MLSKKRLTFDYAVNDKYSFSLLNKEGQKLNINPNDIFYIAADINFDLTDTPCFYSTDYVIEDNIITFTIDTYTDSFLEKVKSEDTELYIEIGIKNINDDSYKIILHDVINAMPRIYVNGTPPTPIEQYYTKDEVDTALSVKADIDDIPNKTSQLQNDSGYITIEQVPTVDLTDYYTKDEVDDKLENITIDTTDFYTKSEIDTALSVKADVSELNNYQLKSEAFSGDYNDLINKPDISGKLDRSGKNQMIVDDGVFTINATNSFDINAPFSSFAGGKVVCYDGLGVMNEITLNSNSSNTAGGLVVVGLNGKIPENLYEKTEVDLSNYYANKDIIISANKDADSIGGDNWHYATIEGGTGLTLKSENTTLIKGNYINLDSYSGINIKAGDDLILDRVPMIRNASANTAGGLVVVGSDGKIPSNLYVSAGGSSYTAGNGITITDDVIAANLANYTGNISLNTATGSYSGYYITANNTTFMIRNKSQSMMNMYCSASYAMFGSDPTRTSYTILKGKNIFGSISYNQCTPLLPMLIEGGVVTNSYTAQNSHTGDLNNTSSVTINSKGGNVHNITLTADTACTLTVPSFGRYLTLMVIVDNANAGSLLFGSEEVISTSETGKYALVFSNLGSSVKLYNKIEV